MASKVVILWGLGVLEYDAVALDASLQEEHTGSASVTSHPLETGAEASDHIIDMPDEVTIEAVMSNTPTIYLAAFRVDNDRAERAYEKLLHVKQQGYLCFIFTTLREYEGMALRSISVPRNFATGDSVTMRLGFKAIRVVESEIVDAPLPTMERAKPKKQEGRKSSKEASLKVDDKVVSALAVFAGVGG